ncbi:MAG: 2-oxoacid:acceptor oxidoreductase family protein [Deltaproteobacteria bacterium]|nr:2-oxoacid:acceptor oxidoreductase family protein [Deltaproteobacteria bacterium]
MHEIVFYGRGGQGAVTAAQVLAEAAFLKGFYAQAFPKFGIERRGAPVNAFARISNEPIESRGIIKSADFAIVTDIMSVSPEVLFPSLKPSAAAILNSLLSTDELGGFKKKLQRSDVKIFAVDATEISEKVFGETPIPITSIAMVGAFAAASALIDLDSIGEALATFFESKLAKKNLESASLAFENLRRESS